MDATSQETGTNPNPGSAESGPKPEYDGWFRKNYPTIKIMVICALSFGLGHMVGELRARRDQQRYY